MYRYFVVVLIEALLMSVFTPVITVLFGVFEGFRFFAVALTTLVLNSLPLMVAISMTGPEEEMMYQRNGVLEGENTIFKANIHEQQGWIRDLKKDNSALSKELRELQQKQLHAPRVTLVPFKDGPIQSVSDN